MSDDYYGMGEEFGQGASVATDTVMVGFAGPSIAAGASATFNVNITKDFRADRLVLSEATRAALVEVTQLSISSEEQIISNDAVPAEVFTPDATHRLKGTIAKAGVGIKVSVRNGTAAPLTPKGVFFGPARD